MFGPLGYVIFGVFYLLSLVARVMVSRHWGPEWIERFVIDHRRS